MPPITMWLGECPRERIKDNVAQNVESQPFLSPPEYDKEVRIKGKCTTSGKRVWYGIGGRRKKKRTKMFCGDMLQPSTPHSTCT
jgi:hypothetical protein